MAEMNGGADLGIRANHVKQRLADGGFALGTWVTHSRSPSLVRMIAAAGFDFVFLDTEHSDYSWETLGTMCEMARASDVVPIVRPFEKNGSRANRIQDLGAMGLMYHDVTERSQVDELLLWMMYPPEGVRGSTSGGAPMDYAMRGSGAEIKAFINRNTLMVIQIESRRGVENIAEILARGGVDVVEIGRGDLSTAYGVPLEARHPIVLEVVDEVIAACEAHGVAAGVNCRSLEDAADMIERGVRCVSFSTDRTILGDAYNKAMSGLQQVVGARAG